MEQEQNFPYTRFKVFDTVKKRVLTNPMKHERAQIKAAEYAIKKKRCITDFVLVVCLDHKESDMYYAKRIPHLEKMK